MKNTIAKIADGILMAGVFIAIVTVFMAFLPKDVSDYVFLFPAILGFISGYFKNEINKKFGLRIFLTKRKELKSSIIGSEEKKWK